MRRLACRIVRSPRHGRLESRWRPTRLTTLLFLHLAIARCGVRTGRGWKPNVGACWHETNGKRNDLTFKTFAALTAVVMVGLQGAAVAQDTAANGDAGSTADSNKALVKVDGATITEQDVDLARQEIGQQLSRIPKQEQRRVLIEFLIENQLIADAAKGSGTPDTSGFKDRMTYWRRRSLRDTYFENNVERDVTDAAAKAFYDKEIGGQKGDEEIKASHILVKTEEKARELFEMIAHDGDFAALAKKHSLDPGSKVKGGDLGFFGRGRMVPAFEKAAFELEDGEVSTPVKSQFGWHIIKLTDRRKQQPPAFDQVKDRIKVVLIRQKVRAMVEDLRKDSKIEYLAAPPPKAQPTPGLQPINPAQ